MAAAQRAGMTQGAQHEPPTGAAGPKRRRGCGAECFCCLRCSRRAISVRVIFPSRRPSRRSAADGDAHTHLDWAAIAILFAIPFDALDGRIARMTNTASEFGKELDSLADVITFGVAPSLLAYDLGLSFSAGHHQPAAASAPGAGGRLYLFPVPDRRGVASGAIQHQPRCAAAQSRAAGRKYFVGMPIPAAAGLLAATVHFFCGIPVEGEWWVAIPWLMLVGLSGFLMVSTWRFWSGKEINLRAAIRSSCFSCWRSCFM